MPIAVMLLLSLHDALPIFRALAKVFPQPVDAILTMKAPWSHAFSRREAAASNALSCHAKRELPARLRKPRWFAKRGKYRSNPGSARAMAPAPPATPRRRSGSD